MAIRLVVVVLEGLRLVGGLSPGGVRWPPRLTGGVGATSRGGTKEIEFAAPLPLERDMSMLRRGQIIRDGVVQSVAFEGRKGAKMWVDVGAFGRVVRKNGTVEERRVLGLLRLPRNASSAIEGKQKVGPRLAKVCAMLREARRDSAARVTCYVDAVRPASLQLVLTAFEPPPTIDQSWRHISSVRVGDEITEGMIAAVGEKTCLIFARVFDDKGKRRKPCPGVLRRRSLPESVVLATQLVKPSGTERVLRVGQPLGRAWVRKVEPASGRYELSLTEVDARVLEAEAQALRAARRDRDRRRKRTAVLKVGDEVEGTVVKVEMFGAVVDFGASATGLVLRNQTDVDTLLSWRGQIARCRVVDIRHRPQAPNAPRISLERIDTFDDDDDAPAPTGRDWTAVEVDARGDSEEPSGTEEDATSLDLEEEDDVDEGVDYDDDRHDDIEEALGLDTY